MVLECDGSEGLVQGKIHTSPDIFAAAPLQGTLHGPGRNPFVLQWAILSLACMTHDMRAGYMVLYTVQQHQWRPAWLCHVSGCMFVCADLDPRTRI